VTHSMRQITDTIHETIYLSKLEAELVATPYFFRLHDIYQSSTVYMTYPSNRTKRYEHCLGTMRITSDMLFAALSNAEKPVRNELFSLLLEQVKEVVKNLVLQGNAHDAGYYSNILKPILNTPDVEDKDAINAAVPEASGSGNINAIFKIIEKNIARGVDDGCLADSALDHYQIAPSKARSDGPGRHEAQMRVFVHKCLIQAMRIVALFHDIGHPPYSHIIESVLNDLYEEVAGDGVTDDKLTSRSLDVGKVRRFKDCLRRFKEDSRPYHMLLDGDFNAPKDLHERVGLEFLYSALRTVVTSDINDLAHASDDGLSRSSRFTMMLFDVCVFEFAIAILEEKNGLFASMHTVVDGTVDSDRLDYVSRDSRNSGIASGTVSYRRLIDSIRLIDAERIRSADPPGGSDAVSDDSFALAFPSKVTSEISDLVIDRYKVFARVNWHHRTMRTASTLQRIVRSLALDYFSVAPHKQQCISPDIYVLWNALGTQIGDSEIRVIQWNDSWLISTLHASLVTLSRKSDKGEDDATSSSQASLLRDLEEILLNRRKFHGIIRRDADSRYLMEKIVEMSGISDEMLSKQLDHEREKYKNARDAQANGTVKGKASKEPEALARDDLATARHSITYIENLRTAMRTFDLQLLSALSISDMSLPELIGQTLSELSSSDDEGTEALIVDFSIQENNARDKIGLPKDEGYRKAIYLYDEFGYFMFDSEVALKPQLQVMRRGVPWLQVYIAPPPSVKFNAELSNRVMDALAAEIGKSLRKRYDGLFESNR